ncbi:MAG: response regulator [Rhodobiaceae bacterium]|nr:response regulator [Rhodobiaceae bacterium]MCC0012335.1 response regulator [Rhodobiaceae bacterium]MCC0019099.1 response regulator [Rhodobiaceae bacterium]MCC0051947.1 response regulator [Rhodobiaceae bacterium]
MARILLVEDDDSVRDFVARALERDGHEVCTAMDGAEGLDLIREGAEDSELLLTDIQMPVMDGIALALNVARERPDLPIMLMTGYAHQRERAHGLDSLIRDVVQKPFTLAEICSRVRNALDGDGDARRASA